MTKLPENKQAIERCLPHAGKMVLIDTVVQADEHSLVCETDTHRHLDNPLRLDNTLSIFAGVEYAAQAMALHTFLSSTASDTSAEITPRKGFVAVTTNIEPYIDSLCSLNARLRVFIEKIDSSGGGSLYAFSLKNAENDEPALAGRLLVMQQQEPNQAA